MSSSDNRWLHVASNSGSGLNSSGCSSVSVSPLPIPIISISAGDDSSESDIDNEPALIFHRRLSTKHGLGTTVSNHHHSVLSFFLSEVIKKIKGS